MAATFQTFNKAPGVYIQEITLPGPLPQVSTSIAAFVGPAEMGPLNQPTLLTSFKQFNDIFGSYLESPYRIFAAHAVNGFFAEGGQQCYFVRVGNGKTAWLDLMDQANVVGGTQQKTLRVSAQQEGTGGNTTTVQVDPVSLGTTTAPKANTTLSAASTSPTATLTSAAGFQPGDTVTLTQSAAPNLSENAIVASIAGNVVTFAAALTNSYPATSTFRTADLAAATTEIRLTSVSGFKAGSYVKISNGAQPDSYDVVRVVNQTTNVITLTNGLANAYPMA